MRDGERAGLALALHVLLWLLGTPGLDFLYIYKLDDPKQAKMLEEQVGGAARAALAIDALNRHLRIPLVEAMAPLQRPFRVSQEWNLYRDGPAKYHLLEIWVDGALRFRTADPAHAWLAPQLRNRHVRPVVESTAMGPDSPNWRGLTRLVVEAARAEDPAVREVELRARVGPFPGTTLETSHRILARAPRFAPVVE